MGVKTMRQKIVAAARERFFHYGYAKTTMAEVASDCNMSPGNLYRFFPGKLDIAEEIAREARDELFSRMRLVARDPQVTATEKLRRVLFMGLEFTYDRLERIPKAVEIVDILRRERPGFEEAMQGIEQTIIAEILTQGTAGAEFCVADPKWTAEIVMCATQRYYYPQVWSSAPLERLSRELDSVIGLLLNGLAPTRAVEPKDDTALAKSSFRRGVVSGFL